MNADVAGAQPWVRVKKGSPDDDELAALLTVVAALSRARDRTDTPASTGWAAGGRTALLGGATRHRCRSWAVAAAGPPA